MSTVTTTDGTRVLAADSGETICELCSRSGNGVDVALLWQRCNNTAMVIVVDHQNGETFLLEVQESENALEMFHHPYAYAGHRRIRHGSHAVAQDLHRGVGHRARRRPFPM
jgi:hypothetical protein